MGGWRLARPVHASDRPLDPADGLIMAISTKLAIEIAERDHWHCRYTGEPVILSVWFQAQALLDPSVRYNKNHRADATDPLCVSHAMQIDHFVAKANGGTDDPENLFCSAARPNIQKGRATNWQVRPIIADTSWDGGLREFVALVRQNPRLLIDQMVARWYRAAIEVLSVEFGLIRSPPHGAAVWALDKG
jgi:hypothetical protein